MPRRSPPAAAASLDRLIELWPLLRDLVIVMTALGLIVYEAAFHHGPVRQSLLLAYTGLLASPVFLRSDKPRRHDPEPPGDPQESPR